MSLKTTYVGNEVRIPEGTLVVLSGLPGSGKSTLKRSSTRNLDRATWLSSDEIRCEITPPSTVLIDGKPRLRISEAANGQVFAIMRLRVTAGLEAGRTVVVDATNLNDSVRREWIDIADTVGAPHLVLILDTTLETCLSRAKNRREYVPADSIREMNQPRSVELSLDIKSKSKIGDIKQTSTPPTGFQNTSKYNFHTMNPGDTLVFTWKVLPEGAWDVITDTHGLFDDIIVLLAACGWVVERNRLLPHPEGRKLLILGDLVDRGEQSIEVVRFIKRAVEDGLALAIKGNHDIKLVRFVEAALSTGVGQWNSYANAETGMKFLMLEEADRRALIKFLKELPNYVLDEYAGTVFAHANLPTFQLGVTTIEDTLYGTTGWKRVDTDAQYQEGVVAGINRHTMVRGHIPQTSEQGHVFSLERHAFQKGELVLLHYDQVQSVFKETEDVATRIRAFNAAIVTHSCTFDFDLYAKRYDLGKAMNSLAGEKLVTRQQDESKMLTVFKYSKQTFWNNSWGRSPYLLKARGLVLDPSGAIVSHPFDKVFNYLENGTGTDIPDSTCVVVTEKLNGFLGIISANPMKKGTLLIHTQGGFSGPFVQYIRDHLSPKHSGLMLKFLSRNNVTLMFEVIHAEDPHIVEYDESMQGLHLLGVRSNQESAKAWTEEAVDGVAKELELRRPAWTRMTFGEARVQLRECKTEGKMIRRDTPEQEYLLKMKSPFYLTTKFLGRLSQSRIKHLFSNSKDFKKTIDEEFYVIVDSIVESTSATEFSELSDIERVSFVRNIVNQLQ